MANKKYHLDRNDKAACGAKIHITDLGNPLCSPLSFDSLKPDWKCSRCSRIRTKEKNAEGRDR